MGKALNDKLIVLSNSLGGKIVDLASQSDGKAIVYDADNDQYIHVDLLSLADITFEALDRNGDVGAGADQLAAGNHDHDLGDLVLLFNNRIV